jgi:hypothetical protein
MMSFAESLQRLRHAAAEGSRGIKEDDCIVRRTDLRELLNHFGRLDVEARAVHGDGSFEECDLIVEVAREYTF